MKPGLEEDLPSIVVVGEFDPRKLHPQWFRSHQLLGKGEAEEADVRIVVREFCDWSTETCLVQATPERLIVQGKVESAADTIRDLVIGTLHVLGDIKAKAIGLNRSMHFDVGGESNWHKVGHTLAPKALWADHVGKPGMRNLNIEGMRTDGLAGKIFVGVQPSAKVVHGVFFDVNNEVLGASTESGSEYFCEVISAHWLRLFASARLMAESVLSEALK